MSIDSAKQVTCSNKTEFLHERYHAVCCFTISMLSVSWQEMELWTSSCLNGSNGDLCQSHSNSCLASSAFWCHQQFSTCLELRPWGVSWSWCAVPAASSACRSTPLVKDLFKKVPACLYLSLCFSISGPETAMFFGLPAVIRQDWNFHVFFCGMEDAIPSFLVVGRWIKRSSWSQASLPRREGMTHQLRTRGVSKHLCVRFFCPTD